MENENIEGQGFQYITDELTGRTYPIPEGGSEVPAASSGDGSTVSDGGGTEVQSEAPVEGGQAAPSDGGSGQGFLEPYLSDVPEDQRGVVEPILERYRQEQDANFNKRFEKLQEEARVPTTIYNSLLQDPIQTLNWIADRMQEERGLDIRSQLVDQWGQPVEDPGDQQAIADAQGEQDKPLTQEDVNRLLEEREEQRKQQAQQEQFQQQQVQKQQETVNSWVDEAAGKFSLGLDDSNGEDPLRAVIIMQANQLHEQGVARGQGAVEMAVEQVAKRFGKAVNGNTGNNGSGEPRVADGGTPPPAKEIDVSDAKQRKARMEELFSGPVN